jgi:uncharacterized protein (TIGR00297 family)
MTASDLLAAVLVTAAFAVLAYSLSMVGRSGAVGGFFVGVAIFLALGPEGFGVLALFVVGGSLLTRLGYERKRRAGTAQTGGGRRGAKNALANCSVAVACAALYALTDYEPLAAAFVASLGAAFADTAESEVGQVYGRSPRLVTTLRRVRPGTDGAVSVPGTLAGVLAAVLTSLTGLALGLVDGAAAFAVVALASFLGTVADSLVGAKASKLGNEATNVVCTLVAALLALTLL